MTFLGFLARHWRARLASLAVMLVTSLLLGHAPSWLGSVFAGLGVGLLCDALFVAPRVRRDALADLEHDRDEWRRIAEESMRLCDRWESTSWGELLTLREQVRRVTGRGDGDQPS